MNSVPSSTVWSLGNLNKSHSLWELLLSKDRDILHMETALVGACFGSTREVQKIVFSHVSPQQYDNSGIVIYKKVYSRS